MSEIKMISVDSLEFDPRLTAVTPIPTLVELLRANAKGDKREQNLARADEMDADWKSLVLSVSENGVRDALKVTKKGKDTLVMDGRHRLLAAREAGLTDVPCIYLDAEDRSIILDSENRRHLTKGAIAYRGVVLYPEVVTEAGEREKAGKKSEPYAMNAQGLAERVGVSQRLMVDACALYRILDKHTSLKEQYETTVWVCASISKLLGQVKLEAAALEAGVNIQPETEEQKKIRLEKKSIADLRATFTCLPTRFASINENWHLVENDSEAIDEAEKSVVEFLHALPDGLLGDAFEMFIEQRDTSEK